MRIRDLASNPNGVGDTEGFGVEVEVENWSGCLMSDNEILARANWSLLEDGSLRNGGMEFISSPMDSSNTRRAIRALYEVGERYNWQSSIRTSTHVHVNMLGMSNVQVATILTAHGIIEPLLFRLAGPVREQNIYCVPWYRAPSEYYYAQRLYAGNMADLINSCKYSSLYLEPLTRFGTLEFRHAPYYERVEDLLRWLDVVERVAYRTPTIWETPEDVIRAYDDTLGPDEFVSTILGPNLTEELNRQCEASFSDIIDDVDSITLAESIATSLCTYKVTDWFVPQMSGEGRTDYRNLQQAARHRPFEFEPDYYDEEPDYYDEEEDY